MRSSIPILRSLSSVGALSPSVGIGKSTAAATGGPEPGSAYAPSIDGRGISDGRFGRVSHQDVSRERFARDRDLKMRPDPLPYTEMLLINVFGHGGLKSGES